MSQPLGNTGFNTAAIREGNHEFVQETVDIDTTGTKLTVEVPGDDLVSLNIEADSSTDFALDVGPTDPPEFANEETYTGTDIRDTFRLGDRFLAVRVTTAAGGTDQATITVQRAR
jgi:hypothetical protein